MPQVITSVNPASFILDDVYDQNLLPQTTITGTNPGVVGVVGTASWGEVDVASAFGNLTTLALTYGTINSASVGDTHDLPTAATLALTQVTGTTGLLIWGVRVTDGTDTKATNHLTTASTQAVSVETATIGGSPSSSDTAAITFTSTSIPSSPVTVTYTQTGSDTVNTVAANLGALINANANLAAAGIFATVATDVITIQYPTSVTCSFSEAATGVTITLASLSASTAAVPGILLSGKYTGIAGNQISASVVAGGVPNTYTVQITAPFAGLTELFQNIPAPTSTGLTFWQNLQTAINSGQGAARGPSQVVTASNPMLLYINPAVASALNVAQYTLSGGTDGRSGVTSTQLLGTDLYTSRTGAFCLRGRNPAVQVFWVEGLVTNSVYPNLQSLADTEQMLLLLNAGPADTSVATAISNVNGYGINDYNVAFFKDWVQFFDSANNQNRVVNSLSVVAGLIGVLPPWAYPGNAFVYGLNSTDTLNSGLTYYTDQLALLEMNSINTIAIPIPAGNSFGLRMGVNTSTNTQANTIQYTRLTNFLIRSIANVLGPFVGAPQGSSPSDPTRTAITNLINGFLQPYVPTVLQSQKVTCDTTNNTPTSIAQGLLNIAVYGRYLGIARFIVLTFQGGALVNVDTNVQGNNG